MRLNLKYWMSIIKIENALTQIKLPVIFQTPWHQNYHKSSNINFKPGQPINVFVWISKENARVLFIGVNETGSIVAKYLLCNRLDSIDMPWCLHTRVLMGLSFIAFLLTDIPEFVWNILIYWRCLCFPFALTVEWYYLHKRTAVVTQFL